MNNNKTVFSKKSKAPLDRDRVYTLKERLLISILSSFTLVFVVMIFGPIDILANNMNESTLRLTELLPGLLPYVLVVFVFFAAYLFLIKSTLINFLSALLLILPVGGCLQLLVFGSTGELTGDKAQFTATKSILITVFWVIVAAALIAAAFISKKKWKKILVFITVLMVGMNGASLIADLTSKDIFGEPGASYTHVLSKKNMYSLSSEENIVVLLVDRLDNLYVDYILETDPSFKEELLSSLDGFTYYTDTTALYDRTFPSVPYMLSGIKYLGQCSAEEYLETAYKNSNLLTDLRSNGYSVNLYTKDFYTYKNGDSFIGVAENLDKVTGYEVFGMKAASSLIQNSLERYIPQNVTSISYGFINNTNLLLAANFDCEHGMYYSDDAKYYSGLKANGLTATDKLAKNFTFLHLEGSHGPYDIDENCMASKKETDAAAQTKGCMKLVSEYLNQMKEQGIYDSSTIIVTGDHGFPVNDTDKKMDHSVTTALFFKPRNASGKLKYSSAQISHENLQAAIIKDAGIKTQNDYGTSLLDIPEGKDTVRYYYKLYYQNSSRALSISKYKIVGDANDFANWHFEELIETEQDWY